MGVLNIFKGQKENRDDIERSYGAGQNPFFALKQQILEDFFGVNKRTYGVQFIPATKNRPGYENILQ